MGGALTRRVSGIDLSGNAVKMKGVWGTGLSIGDCRFRISDLGLEAQRAEGMGHSVKAFGIRLSTLGLLWMAESWKAGMLGGWKAKID